MNNNDSKIGRIVQKYIFNDLACVCLLFPWIFHETYTIG